MRQILIVAAVILSMAAPAAVTGTAVVTAMSLVTTEQAQANTAVLPGWQQSCGRNPRCFERGEARRRARGLYLRYR